MTSSRSRAAASVATLLLGVALGAGLAYLPSLLSTQQVARCAVGSGAQGCTEQSVRLPPPTGQRVLATAAVGGVVLTALAVPLLPRARPSRPPGAGRPRTGRST